MASKDAIRAELRARLTALDVEYIAHSDEEIYQKLTALPEYRYSQRIFAYYSVGREVDTHAILRHARAAGKTVLLPKVFERGVMGFYPVSDPEALHPGAFGIPEPLGIFPPEKPQQGDLMLLPGLSFTLSGDRLGRGGGYYDRFLAAHRMLCIGLCRRKMLSEVLPMERHDCRASLLVTD